MVRPAGIQDFYEVLRHERAQQRPKRLAATLRTRDPAFVMFPNGQGDRHIPFALVATILVHRHGYLLWLGSRRAESSQANDTSPVQSNRRIAPKSVDVEQLLKPITAAASSQLRVAARQPPSLQFC
jgi:hypothetical protein